MPTYRNNNITSVRILDTNGIYRDIPANGVFTTYQILERLMSGLTRLSDDPYYNPNIAVEEVLFLDSTTVVEIDVEDIEHTVEIDIWKVMECNVEIYINSIDNIPYVSKLRPGDSSIIITNQSIEKLMLVPDAVGSCEVVLKRGF